MLRFAAIALFAAPALAQTGTVQVAADRWNYPFNFTNPGRETQSPIFAALLLPGFDDRDSQFLLRFDTSSLVAPALGTENYAIGSISLRVTVNIADRFVYDPSADDFRSSLPATDPDYIPDSDAGQPIEVFPVGFRNGFTADTYTETSPFGAPLVPPAEGARHAFPANFDINGAPVDVSRNVRLRQTATALAIGQTTAVAPAALVPIDTTFTANLDTCDPNFAAYIREGLNAGRLWLMVTSLHPATGGPGGGSGNYPTFYTRENSLAPVLNFAPALDLSVQTWNRADLNADAAVDFNDYLAFLNLYNQSSPLVDINQDCAVDFNDYLAFLNIYNQG